MDWIHCNNCFVQCKPAVTLFLTSCGHMFCQSCVESGSKGGQCKICQSQCSTMKLAPDMTPEVQDFFSEPEELISKISTIFDFQRKHRIRLTKHWMDIAKKFSIAKEEVKRLNALCHKLNDVVKDLQQKNRNLKAQLEEKRAKSDAISPFSQMLTPCMRSASPKLTPHPPSRPAKSTPYNPFQSKLLTPARISKNRSDTETRQMNMSVQKTFSSSGVFLTPSPPASAGSGYYSSDSPFKSPLSSQDMHATILGTFRRSHSKNSK